LYTYALLDYRFPGRLHYNVSPKGCHHIHLDITKPISRRKEITTGSNPCTVIVTQPDARDFKSNPVPGYRLLSKAESLKNPVINDLVSIRAATKEAYKQTGMFRRVDYVPTVLMLGAVLILLSTQDYSKDQKKKG
jgi:glutathione synthase/RimK-type ligase-like ATP-grasp enzyme